MRAEDRSQLRAFALAVFRANSPDDPAVEELDRLEAQIRAAHAEIARTRAVNDHPARLLHSYLEGILARIENALGGKP